MATILATGLSELYSTLPHLLNDITVPDWHKLTPDDVKDIPGLSSFVNSLEFMNAVAQEAHLSIAKDLQEFVHKGFFIPVLGPTLLHINTTEQIAATAYLELIARTLTHPGLLYPLLQFLLQMQYDGQRLLYILIDRINSDSQLTLVSLGLFETLIDINCEDVMLELVFQHLQPCLHLMSSQKHSLLSFDSYCQNFEKFLMMAPLCCEVSNSPRVDSSHILYNNYGRQQTLYGNYHAYLCDARNKINICQIGCANWTNKYTIYESNDDVNCTGKI